MIELSGGRFSCCDGQPRRDFLKAGFLGLGGLSLSDLFRLRSATAAPSRPSPSTAVIFVELAGGPSQFETYDPKPDAPAAYRGPFTSTPTNVPGVHLSSAMAEQAKAMDKLAVIRSLHSDTRHHRKGEHLFVTGHYPDTDPNNKNLAPSVGSYVAKMRGSEKEGLPAYVGVPNVGRYGDASYLGAAYNPFEVRSNPASDNFRVRNLSPVGRLDASRLEDRSALLKELDQTRRAVDQNSVADAMDAFNERAVDIVTGEHAQQAFAIDQEPRSLRERYGMSRTGQSMLLARRLVESGVPFVTVRTGRWDDHWDLPEAFNKQHVHFDRAMAALVNDLHERGLAKDVMVVAMGEFGRTPKVNDGRNGTRGPGGRHHWGRVMSGVMAGGGLPGGTVVGASDDKGGEPVEAPYRPENVLAMVYRHLGLDPSRKFKDNTGRPRYVLDNRGLIKELV